MIWFVFIISLGLVSARNVDEAELEHVENLLVSGQYEEAARYLEEDEYLPEDGKSEEKQERSYFNHVSELGDILLTDEQARQGINFNKYRASRWPGGVVPYTIRTRDFTRSEVRNIEAAIEDFNSRLSSGGGKVRMVRRSSEPDYVNVISGRGCYSYLGKVGGEQALSLQRNGCLHRTTIQHEFMHAIGFTHEHNREDRDNHVEVLWDDIPKNWHSQYEKVNGDDFPNIGRYEWYSIMHYPWWAPDTNGKDAFIIKGNNIDKNRLGGGENDGATRMDIQKVNTLYS